MKSAVKRMGSIRALQKYGSPDDKLLKPESRREKTG
jgi:hypothetical protein